MDLAGVRADLGDFEEAESLYRNSLAVWNAKPGTDSLSLSTTLNDLALLLHETGRLDGIELRVHQWTVEALRVDHVESGYFENRNLFPEGSTQFDCALLMRNVGHEWHSREPLCNC